NDGGRVVITTSYSEPETYKTKATTVVENKTEVYDTGIYDADEFAHYGQGTVVAVLDTGLDYTHPAFQAFQTEEGYENRAWDEEDIKAILNTQDLVAETRSGALEYSEIYVNEKVPFAYDYADDDPDVYPSYSNHGTHVAGIIGGYDTSGYTDKDGFLIDETFKGVVPDCQLAIFKVFTDDLDDKDLGGAVSEDIVAALEDCVKIGVDVINMSLGTSCGFTTTNDGDDEGEMLHSVYEMIRLSGISLICAASNDYSSGYGGVYGTNLAENPDSSTVGSPSTFAAALSVASINGQKAPYMIANDGDAENRSFVFYEESRDIDGNPFDFFEDLKAKYNKTEFEYVVIPGIGQAADYSATVRSLLTNASGESLGRIALIKRGDSTFQEKVEIAMQMGAIGVIIYNNVAGVIRMNLGEIENPVPSVSINMTAGTAMVAGAKNRVGTIKLDAEYKAGPFMSEFSSWGPTHDLTLKPEITAHGGEITSTVPGGYGEQSGTSMASPNMAGFTAVVRGYIEQDPQLSAYVDAMYNAENEGKAEKDRVRKEIFINRVAMQLIMSTAATAYDQDGLAYSPRKQGAGVARMERVIGGTDALLWTDVSENDYRPKLEVGDNTDGVYTMSFNVTNFGDKKLEFSTESLVMTETLSIDKLTVAEQAYMLNKSNVSWKVNGSEVNKVEVGAGQTVGISVSIALHEEEKAYIDESFENGMYVEGFLKLNSSDATQCDLSIPFLGFYGEWEDAPMLDVTSFEVADEAQDGSIKEEDKVQASVYATQPFTSYYNETYILPMGGYVYLLPDDAEPVYVDEDKCSVSRYNNYYGVDEAENYMTSTSIKAVYAGLLRNARLVKYSMYNVETGEVLIKDKEINRVAKAYAGGGSAVPANVELELVPDEAGLVANGKYRMDFQFFMNEPEIGETASEQNTYSFSFTVDYEAPVLEDVRVRYYNYKEDNKDKQRIYLDVDIYDNHYAQALMLCYPKMNSNGELSLMLATDYPTPIRNANPNGTTTVSIEITDIYEKYGSQLYLQVDDYALNNCMYQLNINEANSGVLPDGGFALAAGEENLSLDIYEKHSVSLIYEGESDRSNFLWTSMDPDVAEVRNGEIVGLSQGETEIIVSNRKGKQQIISVTVSDKVSSSLASVPSISFGIIKTDQGALKKAEGTVKVNAGEDILLEVEKDPWYHPMTGLRLVWSSTDPAVATVDQEGNVKTLKKGMTVILARVERQRANGSWEQTLYSASVTLRVQNEFTVSNYTLTAYNGVGGVVTIPSDMNIWYIAEEAFKDNDNITKIIIPSTVIDIRERAFINCTALEEVYFVNEKHRVDENGNLLYYDNDWNVTSENGRIIDWADLSMIYEQAFYGCTKLKKVDFSNVKTATIARECFAGCTSLEEIVDWQSIGTMHHYAFSGCTSLKEVDLTGLHMSGNYVFEGCTALASVTTGKFTALGNYIFKDCISLRDKVEIHTSKIGVGAFSGCINLSGVVLSSPVGEKVKFDIGARAFENCGKGLQNGYFTVTFDGETVRSLGDYAFSGSTLRTLGVLSNIESLGENAFANTAIEAVTIDNTVDLELLRLLGVPFKGLSVQLAANNSDNYVLDNGILYSKDGSTLYHVNPRVTGAIDLSDKNVTKIAAYAFAESNVTEVKLSSSVAEIGVGAFENAAIASISFNGAAITEIPEKAFKGANIVSIELPQTVTKIGVSAFEGSALKNFKINGVTEIGDRAFADCKILQGADNAGVYILSLPATVTVMGSEVFRGCINLKRVVMPAVEKLGDRTFVGATKLEKVIFADGAQTVGEYTFLNTNVNEVHLGETMTKIAMGAFMNCMSLTVITLPETVTEIEAYAFSGCGTLATANGLDKVQTIGMAAFYNTALNALDLTEAVTIGDYAFAVEGEDKEAVYFNLNIPAAVTIGNFAFMNGGERQVSLPASLISIGYGAFASSANLATIEAADNAYFTVKNGVLYRYIDKTSGAYELTSYPTALVAETVDGARVYNVAKGTLRIDAYAFYDLNKDVLDKIVLPYTLNTIGDGAFLESGIETYVFESIQAPVLETIYRAEIESAIESVSTTSYYKGYYYANFETYVYNLSSYVGEKSTIKMEYPSNGVGYDNHIYTLYFGERTATGVLPADETRDCIDLIENQFPTEATLSAWKTADANDTAIKAEVEAASELVKRARVYFNNACTNEQQAQFVSALEEKLLDVEEALRTIKARFGIKVTLSEVRIAEGSTHKDQYKVGEVFDMTGLVVELVYDDYSTEIADFSQLKLVTTEALTKYDKVVEVKYKSKTLRIRVTVTEDSEETPPQQSDSSTEEEKGCGSVVGISGLLAAVALGAAVLLKKKEN
ncbi:MAG: hypothetical protein E7377_03855, partial [Clostridiales bacterium]|nr:hypothetical protein [Clostridiales bacterium]